MTLVSQIINDAYRESNLIAITAAPTDLEVDEGLRALQRVISSIYGFECGELLRDFPLGNNDVVTPQGYPIQWPTTAFIPLNVRLVFNLDPNSTDTYYLHPNPQNGSRLAFVNANPDKTPVVTLSGNGRLIDGNETTTLDFSVLSEKEWIYDSPSATWKTVTPITLDGEMPFPEKYDDLFLISLAMRLNPRNGVELDPQSQVRLSQLMKHFKAQYRQIIPVGSEPALIITPGIRPQRGYWYGWWYGNSTSQFNSGTPYPWGW